MEEKIYTEQEVYSSTIKYFKGDELATNVWMSKYALKTKDGQYLESNPDDMIRRITNEIHKVELKHENPLQWEYIYNFLRDFKNFVFGGSILFGIGNKTSFSSLGNCFFIDNGIDSYGGIMDLEERMIQLMKRRGGVGITLEHLRPKGALVNNSAKSSTGAISFMHRFSNGTREVAQDGRRGALMISMLINHPEIKDFITVKDDLSQVTGANISVKVTDEFMNKVKNEEDFILRWPVDLDISELNYDDLKYDEFLPYNNGYITKVKANDVWNLIVKQAHKTAEPGVLFWDTIIKNSPADMYADKGFKTNGTNPCGEVTLSDSDSCRLGSLNLYSIVDNPFTEYASINWEKLKRNAYIAQRLMDDIIDLEEEKVLSILNKIKNDDISEEYKLKEISLWNRVLKVLKDGRRTGLGGLGLGDMFAALGIKYGTPEATELSYNIQRYITLNSYMSSIDLAEERAPFKVFDYDKEIKNEFLQRVYKLLPNEYRIKWERYGRRNISNLSWAPTGTLGIISQVTSGIEPVFKIYYRRRKKVNPNDENVNITFVDQNGDSWEEYNVLHRTFVKWYSIKTQNNDIEEVEKYLTNLKPEELDELVKESPWYGSEAEDIDYLEKVKMQGMIQQFVDHSISVTHNLPKDITIEEVDKIYKFAWEAGCKGLTIYRDGSRSGVLITKDSEDEDDFKETKAPKRPKELEADYYVAKSKGHEYGLVIGLYKGKPYELFAFENPEYKKNTTGKIIKVARGQYKFVNGSFEKDNLELASDKIEERSLTLMVSMLLRHGAPIKHITNVVKKIDENIVSFSSVIRRYLLRYDKVEEDGEKCPECGGKIIMQDGCKKCASCGWSKCG